jgi:N-acetylneuraminate synthase
MDSLRFLCEEINLPRIKFGSGEITNAPLLLEAAAQEKDVILSTGMSTLDEIEAALGVLAFAYARQRCEQPSLSVFEAAFQSEAGQRALNSHVVLLHCTSDYPCPYNDVNLHAMDTIAQRFKLPVGYSDHTLGIEVAVAAAARGAVIIEKHFTLDRGLSGPDHKASLEPQELRAMVSAIRHVQQALGYAEKQPTKNELLTRSVARKHIVAATAIHAGEPFTADNLTTKRTATGISPMRYWDVLQRIAERDYAPDEAIEP